MFSSKILCCFTVQLDDVFVCTYALRCYFIVSNIFAGILKEHFGVLNLILNVTFILILFCILCILILYIREKRMPNTT